MINSSVVSQPFQLVEGTIHSVDHTSREIVLLVQESRLQVILSPNCLICLNGEKVKLRLLQSGDQAVVSYSLVKDIPCAHSVQVNWLSRTSALSKKRQAGNRVLTTTSLAPHGLHGECLMTNLALAGCTAKRSRRGGHDFEQPETKADNVNEKRALGVMVVDDDLSIRTILNDVLCKQGFSVWLAASAADALEVYRVAEHAIDLLLLDVRMPGIDGPQTLAALQQLTPNLRCCFMTGKPGHYTDTELIGRGAERIISKPICLEKLINLLRELVVNSARHSPDLAAVTGAGSKNSDLITRNNRK